MEGEKEAQRQDAVGAGQEKDGDGQEREQGLEAVGGGTTVHGDAPASGDVASNGHRVVAVLGEGRMEEQALLPKAEAQGEEGQEEGQALQDAPGKEMGSGRPRRWVSGWG